MRLWPTFVFLFTAGALSAQGYAPARTLPTRPQVVAIYIGSTDCIPCRSPELKAALQVMKPTLRHVADSLGRDFSAVGVALDWQVDSGVAFLQPVAEFDEIVVGNNWTNLAAQRFIWEDPSGAPAMPQLLVVERTVAQTGMRMEFGPPRVLKRLLGAEQIRGWVRAGTPLPEVTTSAH